MTKLTGLKPLPYYLLQCGLQCQMDWAEQHRFKVSHAATFIRQLELEWLRTSQVFASPHGILGLLHALFLHGLLGWATSGHQSPYLVARGSRVFQKTRQKLHCSPNLSSEVTRCHFAAFYWLQVCHQSFPTLHHYSRGSTCTRADGRNVKVLLQKSL